MHKRLVALSAVSMALALTSCNQAGIPGEENDNEAITAAGCGVERWAVKTGTDSAASQVNLTPQDTTIAALTALPIPAGFSQNSGRLPNSAEMQVYRLNATLVQYKQENDSDFHINLSDGAGHTMITEIPSPSCVSGGPWASQISAARAAFNAKYTASGSYQAANVPVVITGVGFFDLLHGQTGVAPNGIELHAILSICFPGSAVSGCSAATPDFSLSAAPAAVTGSGTSSVSVAGSGSFSGSVALSASGVPAGATASFSPASIASGGHSTLSLGAGTAAAGTSTVTVTGASGSLSHTTSVSWTIAGGGGGGGGNVVTNGDFETGSLSGWTTAGIASVVTSGAHGGTHAARVGGTSPSSNSSISQTVALPAGSPQLSFWVKVVCPDTIHYDWASVQVKSASGAVLATPLANTCSNSGAWVQKTADLTAFAGTTVTLQLSNHDDNYPGDPTYTLYDDVSVSGGGGGGTPDFSVALASGAVSSTGSAAATDSVTVTTSGGFSGAVALSASGVPSGASASFSPSSVTSGGSTLTLSPGTAVSGTYALTVSGIGGGLTRTAPLSWTLSAGGGTGGGAIQTVFLILMENHNWSSIAGSASAPYLNNTLLPMASSALNYQNPPGMHPSEPNYLWLEAGTNFGVLNDSAPSVNHQSTSQHLVTLLQNSGVSWRSYQEGISGSTCPLANSGLYAPKHNPMVFFDDVTNTNNASSANCISHVRPFTQLATDLRNNAAARYNFITPNLCNDMHGATGCPADSIATGDTWLSQTVPAIMSSAAYRNGGAIFITWDESEGGDVPIGMIVVSPKAKGHGYTNTIAYTHSSTLRTMEEIFAVQPFLGDAANATDLADLFTSFP